MKKVIAILFVMVMLMVTLSASAEREWDTVRENVEKYCKENGMFESYNGIIDGANYYCMSTISIKTLKEECGEIDQDFDNLEGWFRKWYEVELSKHCPEYGEISVELEKLADYNGTAIYHITVTTENDVLNWYKGDQTVVHMIFGVCD